MSADLYLGIIGACAVLSTLALLTIAFALIKLVKGYLMSLLPIQMDVDEYNTRKYEEYGRMEVL